MEELKLKDLADDLLILNKITVDRLFQLDNSADCIALYVFYYKTAKWQKTKVVKANDLYVKKSLKWGIDKIRRTKAILKEHGLIDIVQKRKDGKIDGWYIEISYLVTERKLEDVKIKVQEQEATTPESNNTRNQQVENSTSGIEEINALKEYIKCLKKEIEMLKNNNISALQENTVEVSNIPYNEIIDFLNEAVGTNYKSTSKRTRELIKARFNEGYTLEDFKVVITNKCYDWLQNNEMRKFLRPETLFSNKFESYLNQTRQERKLTTKDIEDKIDFSDF